MCGEYKFDTQLNRDVVWQSSSQLPMFSQSIMIDSLNSIKETSKGILHLDQLRILLAHASVFLNAAAYFLISK